MLADQQVVAGIGNAYSDEILHVARLSPFAAAGRLDDAALDRLHEAMIGVLSAAVDRAVGQDAARLKGEKRSGHARARPHGAAVPGVRRRRPRGVVRRRSFQYCPTCQTRGGRSPTADSRGW